MVRQLIHDPMLLSVKSRSAEKSDKDIAGDLLDTLSAHSETCVGMAANMIGVHKRVIAFKDMDRVALMYNPEIISKLMPYETEEGCLSLLGGPRKTVRYQMIKVRFQDENFVTRVKSYAGFTAQIIQHEIDHCNGVLI